MTEPGPAEHFAPSVPGILRWAILDSSVPGAPVFWNEQLVMPAGRGDRFCAGHAWTSTGELLVAGGAGTHPDGEGRPAGLLGGALAYLWGGAVSRPGWTTTALRSKWPLSPAWTGRARGPA